MPTFIKCTRLNGLPVLVNIDLVRTVEKDWEGATFTWPGAEDLRVKDSPSLVLKKVAAEGRRVPKEARANCGTAQKARLAEKL